MSKKTRNLKDDTNEEYKKALDEYKEGNELSQTYMKISWTATTVFLPVCFGLVAVSYTEPLVNLDGLSLFPLALASVSLFIVWWLYTSRYASYNRSIWKRLQCLEEHTGMQLHRRIGKDDKSRTVKWRIRHVNGVMLALLVSAWVVRLLIIAPIITDC